MNDERLQEILNAQQDTIHILLMRIDKLEDVVIGLRADFEEHVRGKAHQ